MHLESSHFVGNIHHIYPSFLDPFMQSHANPLHFIGEQLHNKLYSWHKGQFIKPFPWFLLLGWDTGHHGLCILDPYRLNTAPPGCLWTFRLWTFRLDSCSPLHLTILPENINFWVLIGLFRNRSPHRQSPFSCVPTFLLRHSSQQQLGMTTNVSLLKWKWYLQ